MDELEATSEPLLAFDVVRDDGNTVIVTIGGELDMSSADALRTEASAALEQHPARLIVDVAGLRFADSSAIALWVQWAAKVDQFELRNPSPLMRRVIDAMGLGEKLGLAR